MSKFHRLSVARVDRETRDAVAITFAVPDALRDTFRWQAGQHLTLRAAVGGEDLPEVRRMNPASLSEQRHLVPEQARRRLETG